MNQRVCSYPSCEVWVFFGDDRCDSHTVDDFGVMGIDCDCYWGWADNMDVDVCAAHRHVYDTWERKRA